MDVKNDFLGNNDTQDDDEVDDVDDESESDNGNVSFFGERYNYPTFILPPTHPKMQFTEGGRAKDLAKNINGITSYVDLLISGDSKASLRKNEDGENLPLGGKYFMKTILKCKDVDTCQEVDRYVYMNNVPTGRIPFTKDTKTSYRGIVPGMLGNLEKMSPFDMIDKLFQPAIPKCKKVDLQVVLNDNDEGETMARHVSLDDLETLLERNEHTNDIFDDKAFTKEELAEWKKACNKINVDSIDGFTNHFVSDNNLTDMYFLTILLLLFYIFYCLIRNRF